VAPVNLGAQVALTSGEKKVEMANGKSRRQCAEVRAGCGARAVLGVNACKWPRSGKACACNSGVGNAQGRQVRAG